MTNEELRVVLLHDLEQRKPLSECIESFSGFALLAPTEEPLPPTPVIGFPTMEMKGWIETCSASATAAPDVGCAFLTSASVYGCGYVIVDDALVIENIGLADVSRDWYAATIASLAERKVAFFADPAISIVGPGNRVYGHWLMDFLPRLFIAKKLLGKDFERFTVLLPSDTPDYAVRLCLTFFGNDIRLKYYDPDREIIHCERLCVPTYPFSRNHAFHSVVKELFEPHRPAATGARKLCVSRKKMEHRSTGIAKSFPQWGVFEALAALHGYEIVYPEQLQLHDQIAMFAGARVVVGEFGSALHNSVFCGPGTVIGATGFFSDAQLRLCSLSNQVSAYVPHETNKYIEGVLHYSCNTVSMAEFFKAIDDYIAIPVL